MFFVVFAHKQRSRSRIEATLSAKIYDKALNLSNSSRNNKTSGEIVNLLSVDASAVSEMLHGFHFLVSFFQQICNTTFITTCSGLVPWNWLFV